MNLNDLISSIIELITTFNEMTIKNLRFYENISFYFILIFEYFYSINISYSQISLKAETNKIIMVVYCFNYSDLLIYRLTQFE